MADWSSERNPEDALSEGLLEMQGRTLESFMIVPGGVKRNNSQGKRLEGVTT